MISRRKARIIAIQSLYSWEINTVSRDELFAFSWLSPKEREDDKLVFARYLLAGVLENYGNINKEIQLRLKDRDISYLGNIERAILRLAMYELLWMKETPRQVVINEAIEIANAFAQDQTYRIINAVLDA